MGAYPMSSVPATECPIPDFYVLSVAPGDSALSFMHAGSHVMMAPSQFEVQYANV